MRKLKIIELISLDGVIQAPSGPHEDGDGGYTYGGRAAPYADPATGEAILAGQGKPSDVAGAPNLRYVGVRTIK